MTIQDQEFVEVPTPTGPMRVYRFYPKTETLRPAIILYSEIFQVTGPIRRLAARMAGEGFEVLVPEVYHEYEERGTVLGYDQAGADRGNFLKTEKPVAAFDGDTWYYISKTTRQIAFLNPTILDQQVVVLHFDQNGVVSEVSTKGLKDAQAITPDPNATPAQGREFTFLEQLIGNFGKFSGAGKAGGCGNGPGSPNPGGGG